MERVRSSFWQFARETAAFVGSPNTLFPSTWRTGKATPWFAFRDLAFGRRLRNGAALFSLRLRKRRGHTRQLTPSGPLETCSRSSGGISGASNGERHASHGTVCSPMDGASSTVRNGALRQMGAWVVSKPTRYPTRRSAPPPIARHQVFRLLVDGREECRIFATAIEASAQFQEWSLGFHLDTLAACWYDYESGEFHKANLVNRPYPNASK